MAKQGSYGGQSMVAPLRRVAVCTPKAAGWEADGERWRELGYLHPVNFAVAGAQHEELRRVLEEAGVEVVELDGSGLSLDAVYAHDASFMTDHGAICLNMGKAARGGEPARHREFYRQLGIPVAGEIRPPGTVEAGDMVWLDHETVLVGQGYRTNRAGIEQLRALLGQQGVEVLRAPLPHGGGPGCCLHLMSLMSMLDESTVLVDMPWLAAETVQLLCERGLRFVEIEAAERDTLACNVLALGDKRLLAIAENERTNEGLREAGFEVRTFAASEIGINGGGGPTCLTRPILRA
ncbi:MAG TPA: arginine deiminase family protein [Terriglobales bacterium]|nr:arginine deiminase family protein [Terriglobales bacterium]